VVEARKPFDIEGGAPDEPARVSDPNLVRLQLQASVRDAGRRTERVADGLLARMRRVVEGSLHERDFDRLL
jgi:hypothetical protein